MRGHSLLPLLTDDQPLRSAALFGQFGGATNITDGRFVWLVYPPSDQPDPLFHYTLMPMHMRSFFEPAEMAAATLHPPFDFTRGMPAPSGPGHQRSSRQHAAPLSAARCAYRAVRPRHRSRANVARDSTGGGSAASYLMTEIMRAHDAPPEAFRRLGVSSAAASG